MVKNPKRKRLATLASCRLYDKNGKKSNLYFNLHLTLTKRKDGTYVRYVSVSLNDLAGNYWFRRQSLVDFFEFLRVAHELGPINRKLKKSPYVKIYNKHLHDRFKGKINVTQEQDEAERELFGELFLKDDQ